MLSRQFEVWAMPQFRFELRRLQLHHRSAPLGRFLDIDFRFFLGVSPFLQISASVRLFLFWSSFSPYTEPRVLLVTCMV